MKPIVLTEFDETLLAMESPGIRVTEETLLTTYTAKHDVCRGMVSVKPVSSTHRALLCGWCGMRVVVPNSVQTYGELRKWCEEQVARRREVAEILATAEREHNRLLGAT